MLDFLMTLNDYSGAISALACIVSMFALWFAISAWSQKQKAKVYGQISTALTNNTDMPFVHSLVLHNQKDKELAIHNIYIRFGKNIYLNLLGKNESELNYVHILPSFGTLTFQLGPSYNYVEGIESVDISNLIRGKYQIVLSTNEGRVNVKSKSKYWSPIYASLSSNYYDRLIDTWRADVTTLFESQENNDRTIKYESYGDRMKYLVVLLVDNKEMDCPIYVDPYARQGYLGNLPYTNEDIANETCLKRFLNIQKKKGSIRFDRIVRIIDAQAVFQREWKRTRADKKFSVKSIGWFKYYIIGYVKSFWLNYIWQENK